MAQFIVRNIEDDIRDKLRARARSHGWSMEEEIRNILRKAASERNGVSQKLGSRIAGRFAKHGLSEDIQEIRGQEAQPPSFDE